MLLAHALLAGKALGPHQGFYLPYLAAYVQGGISCRGGAFHCGRGVGRGVHIHGLSITQIFWGAHWNFYFYFVFIFLPLLVGHFHIFFLSHEIFLKIFRFLSPEKNKMKNKK